jgi:hypothetical protein
VRFNFADFGLEQAVGAIKARVQEQGGFVSPLTAVKRAALYERDAQYLKEKQYFLSSHEGTEIIRRQATAVFSEIERLCGEVQKNKEIDIRVGFDAVNCILTNNRVGISVYLGTWAKKLRAVCSMCVY